MQTAEFNYQDFEAEQQRELDKQLLVKFFIKPMKDEHESQMQGRPIYKDVEYIDIRVPGKKNGGVCRPARPSDIERFPEHYRRFKGRLEQPSEGTPLAEWPPIDRSLVEELAFLNIKTVEQLAGLSDTHCSQIMGGFGLKNKARDFLEYAEKVKDETEVGDLKRENEELKEQMAKMQEQIAQLLNNQAGEVEPGPVSSAKESTDKKTQKKRAPQKKNPLA